MSPDDPAHDSSLVDNTKAVDSLSHDPVPATVPVHLPTPPLDSGHSSRGSSSSRSSLSSRRRSRLQDGHSLPHERASGASSRGPNSPNLSPLRLDMPCAAPGPLAFSILQFLPFPLLVLDSLKTVVLANEAMGRLLGVLPDSPTGPDEMVSVMDQLRGQSLSQVGIDMLQDNRPVWVEWERFLDQLAGETVHGDSGEHGNGDDGNESLRPMAEMQAEGDVPSHPEPRPSSETTAVDVIISRNETDRIIPNAQQFPSKLSIFRPQAKMAITVFKAERNQLHFALTFTPSEPAQLSSPNLSKSHARAAAVLEASSRRTGSSSSKSPSLGSSRGWTVLGSPAYHLGSSSLSVSSNSSPLPAALSNKPLFSSTPSFLQKIETMKDALLDNIETPILAMWKDGSVTLPNKGEPWVDAALGTL